MSNFQNRTLYHGDNLDFLRGMNSKTVHLIATAPPFNKNRDFHATPESLAKGSSFTDRWRWERDVHLVENGFLDFKQWRGVATQYAKNADSFLAICQIRAMVIWTKLI